MMEQDQVSDSASRYDFFIVLYICTICLCEQVSLTGKCKLVNAEEKKNWAKKQNKTKQ